MTKMWSNLEAEDGVKSDCYGYVFMCTVCTLNANRYCMFLYESYTFFWLLAVAVVAVYLSDRMFSSGQILQNTTILIS